MPSARPTPTRDGNRQRTRRRSGFLGIFTGRPLAPARTTLSPDTFRFRVLLTPLRRRPALPSPLRRLPATHHRLHQLPSDVLHCSQFQTCWQGK